MRQGSHKQKKALEHSQDKCVRQDKVAIDKLYYKESIVLRATTLVLFILEADYPLKTYSDLSPSHFFPAYWSTHLLKTQLNTKIFKSFTKNKNLVNDNTSQILTAKVLRNLIPVDNLSSTPDLLVMRLSFSSNYNC